MRNDKSLALSWCAIVLGLMIAAAMIYVGSNPAPMSGEVTGKLYYPEYAWESDNMPWEYAIKIEHENGREACMWYVSRDVYERHEIGDHITRGWW